MKTQGYYGITPNDAKVSFLLEHKHLWPSNPSGSDSEDWKPLLDAIRAAGLYSKSTVRSDIQYRMRNLIKSLN